jgi:hypothetical protein
VLGERLQISRRRERQGISAALLMSDVLATSRAPQLPVTTDDLVQRLTAICRNPPPRSTTSRPSWDLTWPRTVSSS